MVIKVIKKPQKNITTKAPSIVEKLILPLFITFLPI